MVQDAIAKGHLDRAHRFLAAAHTALARSRDPVTRYQRMAGLLGQIKPCVEEYRRDDQFWAAIALETRRLLAEMFTAAADARAKRANSSNAGVGPWHLS